MCSKGVGVWDVLTQPYTPTYSPMVRHSTTLLPYPPTRPRLLMNFDPLDFTSLYTHKTYQQVFVIHRCVNAWVYTTNLTLGKDKSIPLDVFRRHWIKLGGTHGWLTHRIYLEVSTQWGHPHHPWRGSIRRVGRWPLADVDRVLRFVCGSHDDDACECRYMDVPLAIAQYMTHKQQCCYRTCMTHPQQSKIAP